MLRLYLQIHFPTLFQLVLVLFFSFFFSSVYLVFFYSYLNKIHPAENNKLNITKQQLRLLLSVININTLQEIFAPMLKIKFSKFCFGILSLFLLLFSKRKKKT